MTYRKRIIILFSLFLLGCFCIVKKAEAATLVTTSDTISTSRSSASSPLTADQAANATQVTVVDNSLFYLASDSATFRPDTGETANTNTSNVASMSASIASTRIVYFTDTNAANTRHKGDPVVVPITAMHTIKFTTVTAVPTLGKITITFPALATGDANNPASPSATTFQLNNLADAQVKVNGLAGAATFTGTYTNPTNGTSPSIALALTGTTTIPAGTVITILIGCTANAGASCTTQAPRIINPTSPATTPNGTADIWKLNITTRDVTNSVDLDTAAIQIGTVETVQVQGSVDPTFTFSIAGIADGTTLNTGTYCGTRHNVDTLNTGISSTASNVNLGTLSSTASNSAAQLLTITSNAIGGYTITATSSGTLTNPGTGSQIPNAQGTVTNTDTPAPATMTTGTSAFGIHACDANGKVTSNTWGQGPDKFANPSSAFYYTLVNSPTQPASSGDTIVILYRAAISGTTPAGIYRTTITYVATPIF